MNLTRTVDDQDFCIVPLSRDIPSNPLRCRVETCRGSGSLLHAILAVSCYHAGRQGSMDDYPVTDVVDHQNTAVELYRKELNACTQSHGMQLLDTTMVLFLFRVRVANFPCHIFHQAGSQRKFRQRNAPLIIGPLTFVMPGGFSNSLVDQGRG